jgi:hypothetical protein
MRTGTNAKRHFREIPTGERLPVGGRDYDLLDILLQPLIHITEDGRRIVLRNTRQQIEHHAHLIWE